MANGFPTGFHGEYAGAGATGTGTGTGTGTSRANPFSINYADWLEEPGVGMQAAYQHFAGKQKAPPGRKRYFQGQFQPAMNEFLGQLGTQALGDEDTPGQVPTASWVDFLRGTKTDNPFTRMRGRSPAMRGEGRQSTFAPRARFLYNY
jgi:hypothetical protein